MRPGPWRTAAVTVIAALITLLPAAPAVAAGPTPVTLELQLTSLINQERATRGLPPVRVDVRIVASSRDWSQHMASSGSMGHDAGGAWAPGGATRWGENVGYSTSDDPASALHEHFMSSPTHRDNILEPAFSDLGVGVVRAGNRYWVTERFTAGAPARVSSVVVSATQLAERLFDGHQARHAVIVRDDEFPDALAAGPLAGRDGPVLVNPPGPVLHPWVRRALERVLPPGGTVWIVGGHAAVSGGVEAELQAAGWQARRIAGADRFETAAAVATELTRHAPAETVLLSTASDWPDAASGGAFGAVSGSPVLLSDPARLSGPTAEALRRLRPSRVLALGGPSVLSDAVVSEAGAQRLAGNGREETAAMVARDLWGRTEAASAPAWTVVPASGDADVWAWALTAAPLAARAGAPVLLAGERVADPVRDYLEGLGYGGNSSAALHVYGTVSATAIAELADIVGS